MPAQPALMDQLTAPENLLAAWRAVRGNIPRYRRERSAGPDGVTLAEFERDLPAQMKTLRHMLLHNRYQPAPPGLITIAKRSGGTRKIAILNVSDRVVQRAAQQVIEPLYEPRFLPCSFGFRPNRSIQDAVYCVRRMRAGGYGWVVDGDIAACFDSLDHELLVQHLKKRIDDRRVIDLLEQWLQTGMMEHGLLVEKTSWLEHSMQKAGAGLRQGAGWAVNVLTRAGDSLPPAEIESPGGYDADNPRRHRPAKADTAYAGNTPFDTFGMDDDFYTVQPFMGESPGRELQRQAVRQFASGGLVIGAKWARDALTQAAPTALAALRSPAGRILIRRALLTSGGLLGAAVGVAVTAGLIYQQVAPSPVGVLQGSPLSPLLANVYLNNFDVALTRAGYRLVRYADDWVILCPNQDSAETGYNQATIALARLHLKINTSKTRILKPGEPLDWLGATIE